jgi:hypothetical protein
MLFLTHLFFAILMTEQPVFAGKKPDTNCADYVRQVPNTPTLRAIYRSYDDFFRDTPIERLNAYLGLLLGKKETALTKRTDIKNVFEKRMRENLKNQIIFEAILKQEIPLELVGRLHAVFPQILFDRGMTATIPHANWFNYPLRQDFYQLNDRRSKQVWVGRFYNWVDKEKEALYRETAISCFRDFLITQRGWSNLNPIKITQVESYTAIRGARVVTFEVAP